MQKRNRTIFIHIFGSILFLFLPILFSPELSDDFGFIYSPPFHRALISAFLLLVFFYINYYYLIPRFYISKKYASFALLIIGCFLMFSVLPELHVFWRPFLNHHNPHDFLPPPRRPFVNVLSHRLLEFIGVFIFSLLLKLRERLKITEIEKTNAELSYLKAQINPHFLFNTLNSIYSLAIIKSDKVADSIVKLSDMMRYVLSESNFDFVLLEKEKEYIFNYIDLQKMRLAKNIMLNYSWEGEPENLKISPLLLIPFIENSFKHGVNSEEDSEIEIKISILKNEISLNVKNKIVSENNQTLSKSGIGIDTTKKRLDLLYPQNYILNIKKDDNWHIVDLKIYLND